VDDLRELKERIWDLTRALDESPAAEQTPHIEDELGRLVDKLRECECKLAPEDLVRCFCEAWSRRDVRELLSFFAQDAVYHNIPIAPAVGHGEIENMLNLFVPSSSEIVFEIVHIASKDGVVLTERIDKFQMGERRVELPVMGTFEVRDGKIAAWRDYFDLQTWINQTSG
jgi:limonene-1,2-epoxide hydrolase